MRRYPASQARAELAEILNRVAFSREHIILHRHEKDLAAIIPIEDLAKLQTPGAGIENSNAPEAIFQLAAIVESSNDAIIGKTLTGIITSWNPAAERLYGYLATEVKGRSISLLLPPDRADEVADILAKLSRGEQIQHFQTRRLRKDGQIIDISLTISPIKDGNGQIIGASTIARDITEQQQAEAELRSSREQLRALSAQLQSVQEQERYRLAHDIQNEFEPVMTALRLELAWLNKRIPTNRGDLRKKIESMAELINSTFPQLRRIAAQLRPSALDDLGLAAAIELEVQAFRQRTGIDCQLKISPENILINQDLSTAIFRIVQESLANIDSSAHAVTIGIDLNSRSISLSLRVNYRDGGERAQFANINFIGIRERARLFGGEVNIDSSQPTATTIAVMIPVPATDSSVEPIVTGGNHPATAQQPGAPTGRNRQRPASQSTTASRILIADNHAIVREGLKQILAEIPNFIVAGEAANGPEVLQQLRTRPWEVLVMDISLRAENGLDLLKQIKVEFPKLPVLILSAQAEEHYAVRVLKAGAAGYLNKESAPEQLIEAIEKVAGGGQYVSNSTAEQLLADLRTDHGGPAHKILSDREYQVLCLIAAGKTLTEIAQQLYLSVKTISAHRANILRKMAMRNNAELIHYAVQNHLIQ